MTADVGRDVAAEYGEHDADESGYLVDAKRLLLVLQRGNNATYAEALRALSELCHLCWLGGETVQTYLGMRRLFELLSRWMFYDFPFPERSDEEIEIMKKRILELVSIGIRLNIHNQDQLRTSGWIGLLVNIILDRKEELTKHAIAALFDAVLNNDANLFEVLEQENIEISLLDESKEDWGLWDFNVATDLVNMLKLAKLYHSKSEGIGHLFNIFRNRLSVLRK